jgi:hypothetical protein
MRPEVSLFEIKRKRGTNAACELLLTFVEEMNCLSCEHLAFFPVWAIRSKL